MPAIVATGAGSTNNVQLTQFGRVAAQRLLANCLGASSTDDALGFGASILVAFLAAAPTINPTTGAYDISTVELGTTGNTAGGYARGTIARTAFTASDIAGVASQATTAQLTLAEASGALWPKVTHVAFLNTAGTEVIAVRGLDTPYQVNVGDVARLPVGAIALTMPST